MQEVITKSCFNHLKNDIIILN